MICDQLAELKERALILATGSNISETLAIRWIIEDVQERLELLPNALGIDDFPVKHQFADGTYMRQVFLPAGSLIVGRTHKQHHFALLTAGDVSIFSEQEVCRRQACSVWQSPAGTKRIVYAHEDSLFCTLHGTHERDLAKLFEVLTVKNPADLVPALEAA